MPAAFQLRVILITVVLFISMPIITTTGVYECYFFFEFAKCRAHSRTHVLMFEYAN